MLTGLRFKALKTLRINMDCSCLERHLHPLCREVRFALFRWWHEKHGENPHVTALALGVSRRTALRWLRSQDVPLSVAILLEQIQRGPIFRYGLWRGAGTVRMEWRQLVAAEAPRQLSLF